jgi:hypothetical protein
MPTSSGAGLGLADEDVEESDLLFDGHRVISGHRNWPQMQ